MRRATALLIVLMLGVSPALASDKDALEGIWEGKVTFQGTTLRLVFHISQDQIGMLSTTMDSPDQGAKDFPTDGTTFEDGFLKIDLRAVAGGFEGTLGEDKASITGEWKQGTISLPMVLQKVAAASEPDRPQVPREPFPYSAEDVRIPAGGHDLAGTLIVPEGPGPFPGVVLVSGSGAQDRDETIFGHKPFLVLADHLARAGVAVLRYDDRGFGESGGTFSPATTLDYAEDAAASVKYLRERGVCARVGLVGHSEGGIIAAILANRHGVIDFAVSLAGPAMSGYELMPQQTRAIASVTSTDDELVERTVRINADLYSFSVAEVSEVEGRRRAHEYLETVRGELDPLQQGVYGVAEANEPAVLDGLFSKWFRHFLRFDPADDLRAASIPFLALFGGKDLQIPSETNAPLMREYLADGHALNKVVVYPDKNHLFQTAETGTVSEYGQITETLSPEVLEEITDWIASAAR